MRHIVTSFLLCVCSIAFSQKIEPITIYIEFKLDKKCPGDQKFYYDREEGTVFNLYCDKGGSFLWKSKSDTLSISCLQNYKVSSLEEIEVLEKQWRKKNRKILKKKFGEYCCPPYDKNGIFQTFLIEIINHDQLVLYPVEWRGLNGIYEYEEPPKR